MRLIIAPKSTGTAMVRWHSLSRSFPHTLTLPLTQSPIHSTPVQLDVSNIRTLKSVPLRKPARPVLRHNSLPPLRKRPLPPRSHAPAPPMSCGRQQAFAIELSFDTTKSCINLVQVPLNPHQTPSDSLAPKTFVAGFEKRYV